MKITNPSRQMVYAANAIREGVPDSLNASLGDIDVDAEHEKIQQKRSTLSARLRVLVELAYESRHRKETM